MVSLNWIWIFTSRFRTRARVKSTKANPVKCKTMSCFSRDSHLVGKTHTHKWSLLYLKGTISSITQLSRVRGTFFIISALLSKSHVPVAHSLIYLYIGLIIPLVLLTISLLTSLKPLSHISIHFLQSFSLLSVALNWWRLALMEHSLTTS